MSVSVTSSLSRSFERGSEAASRTLWRARVMDSSDSRKSNLSASRKKSLGAEREAVAPELRKAFEEAFDAWKQTWFSGGLAINSNPNSRSIGKEYDALIALGPEIL